MKPLLAFILLPLAFLINWEPNFENAKKLSRENHKLILLNFSGSDWCGPCIAMRKNYLENDDFSAFANENLILVNADFPRKSKNKLADEIVKQNNELAEKYNKDGFFPKTLLLDSNGKVLKIWQGKPEVSVEKFVEELKTICEKNK